MLGADAPVEVKLTDKFWKLCERWPTMHCVLQERGVTTAMLTTMPGAPRFILRFPGVGPGEADEFDRQVDATDAIKVIEGKPEDLGLQP